MTVTSERIKKSRKAKGLTMNQLASKMGVSQGTIVRWENGTTTPRIEILEKLSNILEVSISYLVGSSDLIFNPIYNSKKIKKKKDVVLKSVSAPVSAPIEFKKHYAKEMDPFEYTYENGDTHIYYKAVVAKEDTTEKTSISLLRSANTFVYELTEKNQQKWIDYGYLLLNSQKNEVTPSNTQSEKNKRSLEPQNPDESKT